MPGVVNSSSNKSFKKNFAKLLIAVSVISMAVGMSGCRETKAESGGKTSKIASSDVTLRMIRRENFIQPIKNDTAALREIQRRTGVKIEIEPVPQINYENKIKTLIASDNLPDIVLASQKDLMDYALTGSFLPLLDRINTLAPNFKRFMENNPDIDKVFIQNELYAFPVSNWKPLLSGNAPMIRMDLVKAQNLKLPETYDELLDVLGKLKKAFPKEDIWINKYGTANLFNCTAYALGSGYDFTLGYYFEHDAGGGKFRFGPAHPEFRQVLEFLNKAYARGILDQDYNLSTVQQWHYKLASGKALFYFDSAELGANFDPDFIKSHPEAEFVPLINLKNQNGRSRLEYYREHHWVTNNYAISSKSKNADIAIRLIDWMYSEEGARITNYGIPSQHYTMENGQVKVLPETLAPYKEKTDSFHAMQSDLGTGRFSMCAYIDETLMMVAQPGLTPIIDTLKSYSGARSKVQPPPMGKEEQDRVSAILANLKTYFEKEADKCIMGIRPIDEYDDIILQLRARGSDELEKILNDAQERYTHSHPSSR